MKIGLITYHSAYNYGSVLQAYATQELIKRIGGNCEIINYRTKEQKRVYSIFKWNKNIPKSLLKNIIALFSIKEKKNRIKKFENVINNLFELSIECSVPEDVYGIWSKYDLIVSGSDQIWNKHSNELENVTWDYMYPYLLKDFNGKKVSYASSLANMTDSEIQFIFPYLKVFDNISFREQQTVEKFSNLFGINTTNVLDPTFLLTRDEWIDCLKIKTKKEGKKYILYYSLSSYKEMKSDLKILSEIAKKKNYRIYVLNPMNIVRTCKNYTVLGETDPIDFLELIHNAEIVVTDSYHGSILSANFGKNFYSICKGKPSDFRKTDVLSRIGLSSRIINDVSELNNLIEDCEPINYENIYSSINSLRKKSISYLKKSLVGENYEG